MRNFLPLIFFTLLIGCGTAKKARKNLSENDIYVSDRRIEKKYFYPMFKKMVFLSSLQYSFNNSPEIKKLLAEDKSGGAAGEVIDLEDVYKIAKILAAEVKQDSIKRVSSAPEGLEGKRVFEICLNFYNSKQLDSITRKLYKEKYSKPYILKPITDTIKIR